MSVIQQVLTFLEEEGCDAVVLKENIAVRTGLEGDNGEWVCDIELVELSPEVQVLGIMSYPEEDAWKALSDDRLLVANTLANRVNFEYMLTGSFEVDPEDGSWRQRTSIAFTKGTFDLDAFKHAVFINWTEMDFYYPLFAAILVDGEDLEETWEAFEEDVDGVGEDEEENA